MTLALAILVPLLGGGATIAAGSRVPRLAAVLAVVVAGMTVVLGLAMEAGTGLVVGHTGLQASDTVRMLVVAWAGGLTVIGLLAAIDASVAFGAIVTGAGLVALGGTLVATTIDDPAVAIAAAAAAAIAAVVIPSLAGWTLGRDEAPSLDLAGRTIGAVGGAGLSALLVVAWSESSSGPLGNGAGASPDDPAFRAAIGLGIVAMAALVALRSGAIPAHLWVARLVGSLAPLALPSIVAWGSAAFTLVAIGWGSAALAAGSGSLDDLDRVLVILVALGSLLFGGLAAMLHDDVEHVLGYSIVQDAGVSLLAFASLRGDTIDAAATWLIASAALKTALAGWIAVARWIYGRHRLRELRGWARSSPVLAAAFVIVLIGSVGVPGMALFDARVQLIADALPGWLAIPVVIVALSPLLALGRLLAAGVRRPSLEVAAAPPERVGRLIVDLRGWSRGGPRWWLRQVAAVARANQGLGVSLATVALAALGLAVAMVGAGSRSTS